MAYLEKIKSPADVRSLTLEDMPLLAAEIRDRIIAVVAETGGHLASSLGAVELTLALHRVFHTPQDKIIWDVGHQTYAHKLITGRQKKFATLRQYGGLAGFPKREESEHDAFNTGHSSTSISAAIGFARARDLDKTSQRVVAVIGDGSLSNGLALEALNDAGRANTDLLVILNDNRMSISRPVGGIANYLNRIITGKLYNQLKEKIDHLLAAIPTVGKSALKLSYYLQELTKGLIVPGVLFEELGFRYFGPVDGHQLPELVDTLERVKTLTGPILLHVMTKKGKGFEFAEKDPETFHGTPCFDACTGESRKSPAFTYSQAFSQTLVCLAKKNPRVVAIVAAMTSGTALDEFAQCFPERFYDVGIAEGHAVTMAAGMAAAGYKPVVAIYSTFLQRAYDQIVHDVCLQNLPVIFAIDRAGLVGEDGATHHGVFDIAFLRHIPNLAILSPSSAEDMAGMLKAALAHNGPVAIRYPRANLPEAAETDNHPAMKIGQGRVAADGQDVAILAAGNMLAPALSAARQLQKRKISAAVVDPRCLKPLDAGLILNYARRMPILTVEDHAQSGGFGSAVLELLQAAGISQSVHCLGLPDQFIEHGARDILFAKYGLNAEGIATQAQNLLLPGRTKKGKSRG